MLTGKEVVVPAVRYSGDSSGQRLASFKNIFRGQDAAPVRLRASMKMPRSPLDGVEVVGEGAGGPEDVPPLVRRWRIPTTAGAGRRRWRAGPLRPRSPGGVRPASPELRDGDPRVRVEAAGALLRAESDGDEAPHVLLTCLKDPAARLTTAGGRIGRRGRPQSLGGGRAPRAVR